MDEIKSCIDCVHCKFTKAKGVYCKQGQWMTNEGKEWAYKTLDSANHAHRRHIQHAKNPVKDWLGFKSFMNTVDRCQLYE